MLGRSGYDDAVKNLDAIILALNMMKTRIPNVKTFSILFWNEFGLDYLQNSGHSKFNNFCLAVYEFLAMHGKSVKNFTCHMIILTIADFPAIIPIPPIPENLRSVLAEDLNLEDVSLQLWGVKQIENLSKLLTKFGFAKKT